MPVSHIEKINRVNRNLFGKTTLYLTARETIVNAGNVYSQGVLMFEFLAANVALELRFDAAFELLVSVEVFPKFVSPRTTRTWEWQP